jgi:hypothetical protein
VNVYEDEHVYEYEYVYGRNCRRHEVRDRVGVGAGDDIVGTDVGGGRRERVRQNGER